jgi:hypothetical protein
VGGMRNPLPHRIDPNTHCSSNFTHSSGGISIISHTEENILGCLSFRWLSLAFPPAPNPRPPPHPVAEASPAAGPRRGISRHRPPPPHPSLQWHLRCLQIPARCPLIASPPTTTPSPVQGSLLYHFVTSSNLFAPPPASVEGGPRRPPPASVEGGPRRPQLSQRQKAQEKTKERPKTGQEFQMPGSASSSSSSSPPVLKLVLVKFLQTVKLPGN